MKIKFTLLFTLIFSLNVSSNANPDFDKLKNEITKNLQWFSDTLIYLDYEEAGIDIDSLASITELKLRKLLTYKESKNLKLNEFPNLKLGAYTQDSLKIRFYYFSNVIGPTGYTHEHTVCQWQNQKGKLFSYILSFKISGEIRQIYKLKSNSSKLYLVLSQDYSNTIAYVIQFKEDYLILDYPAFVDVSSILLKSANVSFDPEQQILSINLYKENSEMEDVVKPMVSRAKDINSYKKILKFFEDKETVSFKFNGWKFIE